VIVVSDTSPLVALNHLRLLDLLAELFDEVLVPPAVKAELGAGSTVWQPLDLAGYVFVRVQAPQNAQRTAELAQVLDPGESEAVALAVELGATILIVEAEGRRVASRLGLRVTGTIAILLEAKRVGRLDSVKTAIDRLRSELRFFISRQLRQDALRLAAESE